MGQRWKSTIVFLVCKDVSQYQFKKHFSAEVVIPNNSMFILLSTSELWCSWSFINSLMEVMVARQGAVGTQRQKGKLNFSELCKQQWTIWRSFVRQTNYCKQHWQLGQSRYPPKTFLVLTFLCYLPLFFSFFLLFSLFIAVTDVGWKEGETQSVKNGHFCLNIIHEDVIRNF